MILIGENIHVVSAAVKEALLKKDEAFIKQLISLQNKMDYADLNVGPARGELSGILNFLCPVVEANSDLKISLDTVNFEDMKASFEFVKNQKDVILNSTAGDSAQLDMMTDFALEKECNLIALTMTKAGGIPDTCDGRMEIAFEIYEQCLKKNLLEKLYFDPLVLPLTAAQAQAKEALDTLKMLKETFEVPVKTVIGLSNISNGSPAGLRRLINRVYAVLAFGAGLDAVIMDAADDELIRILKMLDSQNPENETDKLYLDLSDMIKNFTDLEEVSYDKSNHEQVRIIKTCGVLLNKKIYSDSFAQV